jgi:hypothetical protein
MRPGVFATPGFDLVAALLSLPLVFVVLAPWRLIVRRISRIIERLILPRIRFWLLRLPRLPRIVWLFCS